MRVCHCFVSVPGLLLEVLGGFCAFMSLRRSRLPEEWLSTRGSRPKCVTGMNQVQISTGVLEPRGPVTLLRYFTQKGPPFSFFSRVVSADFRGPTVSVSAASWAFDPKRAEVCSEGYSGCFRSRSPLRPSVDERIQRLQKKLLGCQKQFCWNCSLRCKACSLGQNRLQLFCRSLLRWVDLPERGHFGITPRMEQLFHERVQGEATGEAAP